MQKLPNRPFVATPGSAYDERSAAHLGKERDRPRQCISFSFCTLQFESPGVRFEFATLRTGELCRPQPRGELQRCLFGCMYVPGEVCVARFRSLHESSVVAFVLGAMSPSTIAAALAELERVRIGLTNTLVSSYPWSSWSLLLDTPIQQLALGSGERMACGY
eukprot:6184666-Pleurochrysis_carterae.AAC.1